MFVERLRRLRRARVARRHHGRAGFTIVELIVATVVLSIGILSMARVMATISARRLRATSRVEMTAMAESKLEELRAIATSRVSDTLQVTIGGSLSVSTPPHADSVSSPAGRWYVRRWTVDTATAGTRAVTVRIEPRTPTRYMLPRLDFQTLVILR